MRSEYAQLKEYMDQSRKTVAVTGAGISYLYGMRRLKQSVGRMNAGRIFSASYLRKNPERFYAIMKDAFLDATFVKGPSTVHKQLAELERQGKLHGIITTNVDCMHTIAGSKNVAEIQGSLQVNCCSRCGRHVDGYEIWKQDELPRCETCGGEILPWPLYSHIGLWEADVRKARNWIAKADLILVIGTRGNFGDVYWEYRRRDAVIVQINPGRTGFDGVADLNIREGSDDVFRKLQAKRGNAPQGGTK